MSIFDKLWADRDAANQVATPPVASDNLGPGNPLKGMVSKKRAVEIKQAQIEQERMYEYMAGY